MPWGYRTRNLSVVSLPSLEDRNDQSEQATSALDWSQSCHFGGGVVFNLVAMGVVLWWDTTHHNAGNDWPIRGKKRAQAWQGELLEGSLGAEVMDLGRQAGVWLQERDDMASMMGQPQVLHSKH